MPTFDIYTRPLCPFCMLARRLLTQRGLAFRDIDVSRDADAEATMMARSQRTSVPQVFLGDHHIGGCDDLTEADRNGELAKVIANASKTLN